MTADRSLLPARCYATCGHADCDWSQACRLSADARYLGRMHQRDAHQGGNSGTFHFVHASVGPWSPPPFRPTAIDYMLAYPEFFAWRAE